MCGKRGGSAVSVCVEGGVCMGKEEEALCVCVWREECVWEKRMRKYREEGYHISLVPRPHLRGGGSGDI